MLRDKRGVRGLAVDDLDRGTRLDLEALALGCVRQTDQHPGLVGGVHLHPEAPPATRRSVAPRAPVRRREDRRPARHSLALLRSFIPRHGARGIQGWESSTQTNNPQFCILLLKIEYRIGGSSFRDENVGNNIRGVTLGSVSL